MKTAAAFSEIQAAVLVALQKSHSRYFPLVVRATIPA